MPTTTTKKCVYIAESRVLIIRIVEIYKFWGILSPYSQLLYIINIYTYIYTSIKEQEKKKDEHT